MTLNGRNYDSVTLLSKFVNA